MHVVFVSLGQPLLGVEYLSAYLKRAGHTTGLVHNPSLFDDRFQLCFPRLAKFYNQDDLIVQRILEHEPDLLAFSTLTPTFDWMVNIARRVRQARPQTKTIFGGIHASAVPEYVMKLDEVDFVCVGEGELPLVTLADSLEKGIEPAGIPNIWTKNNGQIRRPPLVSKFMQDLDSMPFPDKELYADTFPTQDVYNLVTGRGCPYRCTFCFNNNFAELPTDGNPKEYIRRRSPDNVIKELLQAKERFHIRTVQFWDDIFTMDMKWLSEFLPRYKKEIGLPWVAETHANFMDDELAQMLKDAGCVKCQMGIQSLNESAYKRTVLKRNESLPNIIKTFNAFKKANLTLTVDHIFGLPGENAETQERARQFYLEHTPSRVSCFWLCYMPGLEITQYARQNGTLSDKDMEDISAGKVFSYHEAVSQSAEVQKELDVLSGYMIAFHMIPIVPKFMRRFMLPRVLNKIPFMTLGAKIISFIDLVLSSCFGGDFIGRLYFSHYLFYLVGPGRKLNKYPVVRKPAPATPIGKEQTIGYPPSIPA